MAERTKELTAVLVREALIKRGVERVLLDLDDTLLQTHKVFIACVTNFHNHIRAQIPDLDFERYHKLFNTLNMTTFTTRGVRPDSWDLLVTELADYYPHTRSSFLTGLPLLKEIYGLAPDLEDGAIETLNVFHEAGTPLVLVTHGNLEWTNLKIDKHGLREHLTDVYIVSEDGKKTSDEWARVIRRSKAKASSVMVVGDNAWADINPAYEAGVRNLVWINKGNGWGHGEVPEGTIEIKGIKELVNTLLK